jgi:tellurite resistance protein
MGFLDSLKSLGSNLLNEADTILSRFSDKSTFVRVVQASYLVALADGNVSDEEKVALGRVIARKLPKFKASEVSKEIEACAEICALSIAAGKVDLMENILKNSSHDNAKIIMLGMLAVANADQEFAPSEQSVAKDICSKLGLSPRDYGL